jgi:hypothetical protein
MRTFHTGGVASRDVVDNELRNSQPGRVAFHELMAVEVPAHGDEPAKVVASETQRRDHHPG